jgi:hypothetical protein
MARRTAFSRGAARRVLAGLLHVARAIDRTEVLHFMTTVTPRAPMPATLDALAHSVTSAPPVVIRRLADFVRGSRRPFREIVDAALELLGGVVPEWPLLSEWNRWCVATGARFFVWEPARGEVRDRTRLEALLHTIMMISAKEQAVGDYLASRIGAAEVAMAGDDCPVCEAHRHRVVPLSEVATSELPPFHPGCRCGVLPHLD